MKIKNVKITHCFSSCLPLPLGSQIFSSQVPLKPTNTLLLPLFKIYVILYQYVNRWCLYLFLDISCVFELCRSTYSHSRCDPFLCFTLRKTNGISIMKFYNYKHQVSPWICIFILGYNYDLQIVPEYTYTNVAYNITERT